jgi:hypothetical protein
VAKEYDNTPQESRQQWTSLDEGKGKIKKQPPHHLHGHLAHALVTYKGVSSLHGFFDVCMNGGNWLSAGH